MKQKIINSLKRGHPVFTAKNHQKSNLRLLLQALGHLGRVEKSLIKKAYLLAEDAHKFQKRLSGEPYIVHPFEVALVLANLHLDYETVCAALLHDVLEDTSISEEYIFQEFGKDITLLVKAVTKISVIKKEKSKEKSAAEQVRKIIFATIKDPRVILVKLADKLHNMRTLEFQPAQKIKRIAKEVHEIYAPIAGRLGIYKIKSELEDIAFMYLLPNLYQEISNMVSEKKEVRQNRVNAISSILLEKLKEQKIKSMIEGRFKHFYSIYQKMLEKNRTFDEIMDLTGLRILVESTQACYQVLGVVHTLWRPVPGRFKDYIALPKSNGYQSLHTTVVSKDGSSIEIQIRTHKMHLICENGIAAHWSYKSRNTENLSKNFELLDSISNLEDNGEDPMHFLRDLKDNLLEDEIYVFTPSGEIVALPRGATVLDFAFKIHTELGIKCAGAKIGARLVSIRTTLHNGNQVEIITNSAINPTEKWLKYIKTSQARVKVRHWLKKHTEEEKKNKKEEMSVVDPVLIKTEGSIDISVHSIIYRSDCCQPSYGDKVKGVLVNKNIVLHKSACSELNKSEERAIDIQWSSSHYAVTTEIVVHADEDAHAHLDMIRILTRFGAHIVQAELLTLENATIQNRFQIEIDTLNHLNAIVDGLKHLSGVNRVEYNLKKGS